MARRPSLDKAESMQKMLCLKPRSRKTGRSDRSSRSLERYPLKKRQRKDRELQLRQKLTEESAKPERQFSETKSQLKTAFPRPSQTCRWKSRSRVNWQRQHSALTEQSPSELAQSARRRWNSIRISRHLSLRRLLAKTWSNYCYIEFNKLRGAAFKDVYFEGQYCFFNRVEGDFIYRENATAMKCLSIMFEMKNEMDATPAKSQT